MLPYFLLLLASASLPFVLYRRRKITVACDYNYLFELRSKATVFLFFFGFFILLALRDITVGVDLYEYQSIFEVCSALPFKELSSLRWEIGYTVYNKLVSFVSGNYRIFLIITAFITLVPIYKLYSKEKRYSFLLILLFINMPCFLMIFSGLRQAIATSVGILAYMCIENRKHIWGALLILLATSFHISAAILFLLYPVFFWKIKTKHLIFIMPILVCIYVLKVPIFMLAVRFMPDHYVEFYSGVQQTGAFGMLVLFLMFAVFSFVILDENAMDKKDYFMRNVLLLSAVFQFFVPINGLVQRASYYFLIFAPVSILRVVQAPKRSLKNVSDLAIVVMTCFFALYFFYNALFSTDNLLGVFPYKFFWEG